MSRHTFLPLALLLIFLPAIGAVKDESYDEYAIRPADIPKDAPRFRDYPATPYVGPTAAPDVRSDSRSRMYRTQLREWAKEKPNFAGRYILATWGCGTSCTQLAIIDASTGKVFHPLGARMNWVIDVHHKLLVAGEPSTRRADFGALRYSTDSRLLVLIGTPEGRRENHGISYFVWENEALRRIRFVSKASHADKK
jgi:hypothetical protein